MIEPLVLLNVRPWGGDPVDVTVVDGRVARHDPPGGVAGGRRVDGHGGILLPSLVDAHMHLDKTLWGLPWEGHQAGPSRAERIAYDKRRRRELVDSLAARAGGLADQAVRMGTGHIRSHVDVEPELGLAHVDALLALRERLADRVSIELVAFPQFGLVANPGTAAVMADALASGVEVVGGIDPETVDNDRRGHLDAVFGLAERFAAKVDIHLHETGEAGAVSMDMICERTRALGLQGRVAVSHAFCLGTVDEDRLGGLIDGLAAAGVAIVTYAPGASPVPPLDRLRAAGVAVAVGSDGVRDTWTPYGNADMLERAMMLAYRLGFRRDEEIEVALRAVTDGGALVLGLGARGTDVGRPADLMIVNAGTVAEAVCARSADRLVVKAGEIVSVSGVFALD